MSQNPATSDPTIEPEDGTSTTPGTEADDAGPSAHDASTTPPGEHSSELPGDNEGDAATASQEANAEASEVGQPSQ